MRSHLRVAAGLALAAALAVSVAAQDPVAEWIRTRAIPLKTPEAGAGFADLQPLKQLIGNARIVSLGEATHGTREFFQLKHRLLEFLATEMGFTIFSIEANMPEAYRVNDYVLTGKGDPAQLLRGMYFWTWDTEEVLEMIKWMRRFNESGRGPLEFTGFDMQTPTVAMQVARDLVLAVEPAYEPVVAKAIDLAKGAAASGPSFGVATGSFPIAEAAGKRVKFSGYIKTEGITRGYAGLWWRVDGPGGVLAFDNMANRGVTGTTDWKRYELDLPVAGDVKNINFGLLLTGDGTAWFDGLAVDLDGTRYTNPALFDFDFESAAPKGLFPGGNGYRSLLDNQVFQSGKQSLRLAHAGAAPGPPPVSPAIAAQAWKDIVSHLTASAGSYRANGQGEKAITWGIQNARVVLQSLQMRTNEVSRDRSMADNVKWILDQDPKRKIVLWAHNGHVSQSASGMGFVPMGRTLREMYGDAMVVMGFAFNQGSFQAIEQGKALRDFTVPPAPAGSLDATLAAAELPLFALDLRAAPTAGPVADWLAQSHASRTIGAVFSEAMAGMYLSPIKAREWFDVVLFVEKTTAARKNPGR